MSETLNTSLAEEREILKRELGFFERRDQEDIGNYAGVLTTTRLSIVTRRYPEFINLVLGVYDQMETPKDMGLEDRFVAKYLTNRITRGDLVSEDDVARLREDVVNGKYKSQLAIFEAEVDEVSKQRRQRGSASRAGLMRIPFLFAPEEEEKGDIVSRKRQAMSRWLAIQANLQTIYGEVDYSNALLTELILEAPFLPTIVSDGNIDSDAQKRHKAYLLEARKFSGSLNPLARYGAFERLTKDHGVGWVKEERTMEVSDFDQSYLQQVYEVAHNCTQGLNDSTLDAFYGLLRNTVLRRGKLFSAQISQRGLSLTPTGSSVESFDDIGDYEEQKSFYRALLERLKINDPITSDLRIVLSAGKPGLGKTLGVQAFLSQLPNNAKGIFLESEGTMMEYGSIINLARMHKDLHIFVVMEDIDTLAADRRVNPFTRKFLEIDSADSEAFPSNLHILATTNRPDVIDPAVIRPGRTSKILVYEEPKKVDARRKIVEIHVLKNKLNLPSQTIDMIAAKTSGFTPDEVRHVVWSIRFEGLDNPTSKDVDRYIAEVKRKHKIEKDAVGFVKNREEQEEDE